MPEIVNLQHRKRRGEEFRVACQEVATILVPWQLYSASGAMKKAGYKVESFKSDGGERTYRINR
jgi:hypothetical protein